MTQILDVDPLNDFADDEAYLAEIALAKSHSSGLEKQKKRLKELAGKTGDAELEYAELLAMVRKLEEKLVWTSVSATALFHTQICDSCHSEHRFFIGWMTEQKHKHDPNARRLVRGYPIEPLPERIEQHTQGHVELCGNCVESILAINAATRSHHV